VFPSDNLRTPPPGLLLVIALAAVALAYAQAPSAGFVWDDHALIENEALVRELHPPTAYFGRMFWSDPVKGRPHGFYRPLTTLSYAIDYRLGGGSPTSFHFTNVALHLAVCTMVFLLARKGGAGALAAALAALLFGTFPRLTESVTWISGRTDVLAALFVLLALWLHESAPERSGRRIAAAACILLGLLCKEVAIAGAVALIVWEVAARPKTPAARRLALNLAPLGVALGAYAALRASASGGATEHLPFPFSRRLLFALQALGTYAGMILDPLRPRLQIGTLGVVQALPMAAGVAVLLGLLALTVYARRAHWAPLRWACAALTLSALLMVLHLIPLPVHVVATDRYLYVPLAGLAVGLASGSLSLGRRASRLFAVLCAVAAVAFCAATWLRNLDWEDEARLWRKTVDTAPEWNGFAYGALGDVLLERERPAEALTRFQHALMIDTEAARTYGLGGVRNERVSRASIARSLEKLGRFSEALAGYNALARDNPDAALFRLNHAMTQARRGAFGPALDELREIQRAFPDEAAVPGLIAKVSEAQARWQQLPPERPEEPPSVTAERAALFDGLGGTFLAGQLWQRVANDERSDVALVRRAAGYLAYRGDRAAARAALDRLERMAGPSHEETVLREALTARFGGAR